MKLTFLTTILLLLCLTGRGQNPQAKIIYLDKKHIVDSNIENNIDTNFAIKEIVDDYGNTRDLCLMKEYIVPKSAKLLISLWDEYSQECWKDSTLECWRLRKSPDNYIGFPCYQVPPEYYKYYPRVEYVYRKTGKTLTFEGFIEFIRKKYKL
jgi:hypothetical protein